MKTKIWVRIQFINMMLMVKLHGNALFVRSKFVHLMVWVSVYMLALWCVVAGSMYHHLQGGFINTCDLCFKKWLHHCSRCDISWPPSLIFSCVSCVRAIPACFMNISGCIALCIIEFGLFLVRGSHAFDAYSWVQGYFLF